MIAVAHHSETLEKMVVYKALYDSTDFGMNAVWVRPYDMFNGMLEVDGKEVKRFEFF